MDDGEKFADLSPAVQKNSAEQLGIGGRTTPPRKTVKKEVAIDEDTGLVNPKTQPRPKDFGRS